jgi:C4-dicarboxylate transporter DctM subunit
MGIEIGVYILGLFLLLLFIGVPIFYSFILSTVVILLFFGNGLPPLVMHQVMFSSLDSFTLMAIPFFVLAGNLMTGGGLSRRLVRFAESMVGHVSGGLAMIVTMTSTFFAAVSGSSPATVAAVGGIMVPEMAQKGYDKAFASSVAAASGILGIIIPPSIPMIVYGVSAGVSIGDLFLAGIVPGLLLGALFIGLSYILSKKYGSSYQEAFQIRKVGKSFKKAIWGILMPVFVLGGIYGGMFTPTEAAAVSVVYGFIVGMFIYKELKMKELPAILVESGITSAIVMIIIAGASAFGWVLTSYEGPLKLAEAIMGWTDNVFLILLIINVFLLFLGTFMDTLAAITILTPLLVPLTKSLGIDPVHFGIVLIINLAIGMITPPMAINLFVASRISSLSVEKIAVRMVPYLAVSFLLTLFITYVPEVVMALPNMFK